MIPERFAPVLAELAPLAQRFRTNGHRLYLVGGTVRDLLGDTGRTDFDMDLTTDARPPEIKACLEGWADAIWTQGERFGTIGANKVDPTTGDTRPYEITTFRAEAYTDDSRKPHVVFADEIDADLSRRDFTVNAMALELTGDVDAVELVDPFNGAVDLAQRVMRTPLGPDVSFSDDPLRMLRAARFIARYQLKPTGELVDAVHTMKQRLEIVSAERIRDELDKLMVVDHPAAGLWFLFDTGLADEFVGELSNLRDEPDATHGDALTKTIAIVEQVRPLSEWPDIVGGAHDSFDVRVTRLAALFHGIAAARMTRKRMSALRYSNDDVRDVSRLVELHARFRDAAQTWTDPAVRRYVRDAGHLLDELNVLLRCVGTTQPSDEAALVAERMDELEARIAELGATEDLAQLRPGLDGNQVIKHLGIKPGRVVGEAMNFLMDIRIEEGELTNVELRERLDNWHATRDR